MNRRDVDGGLVAVAGIIVASLVLGVLVYATHNPSQANLELPPSPVEGVVVRIDEESLNEVNQIDILMPSGRKVTLSVGQLENATQFSPSHLVVHMATGQPILAYYRLEDGRARIYRLEDALVASPGSSGASPGSSQAPAASSVPAAS